MELSVAEVGSGVGKTQVFVDTSVLLHFTNSVLQTLDHGPGLATVDIGAVLYRDYLQRREERSIPSWQPTRAPSDRFVRRAFTAWWDKRSGLAWTEQGELDFEWERDWRFSTWEGIHRDIDDIVLFDGQGVRLCCLVKTPPVTQQPTFHYGDLWAPLQVVGANTPPIALDQLRVGDAFRKITLIASKAPTISYQFLAQLLARAVVVLTQIAPVFGRHVTKLAVGATGAVSRLRAMLTRTASPGRIVVASRRAPRGPDCGQAFHAVLPIRRVAPT